MLQPLYGGAHIVLLDSPVLVPWIREGEVDPILVILFGEHERLPKSVAFGCVGKLFSALACSQKRLRNQRLQTGFRLQTEMLGQGESPTFPRRP